MSFIAKLFFPKMPAMPEIKLPDPEEVPKAEDTSRKDEEAAQLREKLKKRRGRRSTILTGSTGLNPIDEENIDYKVLLNIPYKFKKTGEEYIIPDNIKELEKGNLIINRVDEDYGPITRRFSNL